VRRCCPGFLGPGTTDSNALAAGQLLQAYRTAADGLLLLLLLTAQTGSKIILEARQRLVMTLPAGTLVAASHTTAAVADQLVLLHAVSWRTNEQPIRLKSYLRNLKWSEGHATAYS
jgi:hypothetical protein